MADIRPFKCIRPEKGLEDKIAALPYDVYNREDAKKLVRNRPLSFLNIDRPETQFDKDIDIYSPEVYKKGRELFLDFIEKGYFIKDNEDAFYLYELIMDGRSQTGIVALASTDDYKNNIIKKHENVTLKKLEDRIRHIQALGAHTGPIFLAHRRDKLLKDIINEIKEGEPLYSFKSDDGICHNVWRFIDKDNKVSDILSREKNIYIADGHHRCASAVAIADKNDGDYKDSEHFLSVIFDAEELYIMPYNRAVRDLNGYTEEEFFSLISEKFEICEMKECELNNINKSEYGMYISKKWYKLKYIGVIPNDPADSLDVAILQNNILAPVLGIGDPRVSERISFVGGIKGYKELTDMVDNKNFAVSFFLHATSMNELMEVSDANKLMPPKSTWFEPKLRSGLFIHEI